MANPDILFRGIPRGPTRGYTAQVLEAMRPERVVIPCCGSFSLAVVARQAGVLPEAIVCGDISLYSTALGHAMMDRDWRLDVKDHDLAGVVKPYLSDPVSKAAAVLFAIRVLQYKRKAKSIHMTDRWRELVVNADAYIGQLKAQIDEKAEGLSGLQYRARDMWETLEEYREEPGTALLVNPPRYTGGYDRMFQGIDTLFDWDEPHVSQFIEKDYARLMDLLGQSQAMTLMYYATPQEDPTPLWGEPWRAVFADRPGNRRMAAINWIIANRQMVDPAITRSRIEPGRAAFPLFTGEVSADSDLRAVNVEARVGDYYRDLFIHKLPGGFAERYAVLLLDGYLLGVLGLNMQEYRRGHGPTAGLYDKTHLTFAFTVFHDRYKRLHKLTLMSLVGTWLWDQVYGSENWYKVVGCPAALTTTMLTPYPENKTARGVLKMMRREKQSDGSYKLSYRGSIKDRTSEETLGEWLKKYGTLTR